MLLTSFEEIYSHPMEAATEDLNGICARLTRHVEFLLDHQMTSLLIERCGGDDPDLDHRQARFTAMRAYTDTLINELLAHMSLNDNTIARSTLASGIDTVLEESSGPMRQLAQEIIEEKVSPQAYKKDRWNREFHAMRQRLSAHIVPVAPDALAGKF